MSDIAREALAGRWRSGERDTELGRSIVELCFGPEQSLSATIVFLEGGERLAASGRYEIVDELLVTEVLSKGQPMKIEIDDGELVLDDGTEAVRYHRFAAISS